jgi:hypothetical protein
MGHTRLGTVPKTRKWNELVEQIAGRNLTGKVTTAAVNIGAIAAQTLDAAQQGLDKAAHDPGVLYTFYLLTQVTLASRTPAWERALGEHGIRLANDSTVFDFTAEVQRAIDRYISQNPSGATDVSEIAQQSAGEAITGLAGTERPVCLAAVAPTSKTPSVLFRPRKGSANWGNASSGDSLRDSSTSISVV